MDLPADAPIRTTSMESNTSLKRSLFSFPWWFAILILIGLYVATLVRSNEIYGNIFTQLKGGVELTLRVSFIAFISALVIGLLIGLVRANPPKPGYGPLGMLLSVVKLVLYNAATLYVQVLRGLPILVTLLIVAFVVVPEIKRFSVEALNIPLDLKGTSAPSAIIALAFTYGAFLSETFRAGIQSIDRGQVEAARSLGMNYPQAMRYVVLPQAVRRVLPPLGNDMIAMIKDSSLVAILGVPDITQLAKLSSSASFRYLETYMIAATIYLTMTVIGSLVVRFIERRSTTGRA
jgi:polar amino acid transport system permease protein